MEIKNVQVRKVDNLFNNDPFNNAANLIAEERIVLEDVFKNINDIGFKYDWLKYCCSKCSREKDRTDKYNQRKRYYESAETFVDYYLDISIYFKKMMEIDLIKNVLFNKLQRSLFNFTSTPNFSFKAEKEIKDKLEEIYVYPPLMDNKMESLLQTMINFAKEDKKCNRIIELIQNNSVIFFE